MMGINSMSKELLTQQFLKQISRRLSGRRDCKSVEYVVGIGVPITGSQISLSSMNKPEDYVYFVPDICVYRDKNHRKEKDIFRVVDLILHKYHDDLVEGRDEYGNLRVDTSKLVKGVYKYQISMDGKRRRWIWYKPRIEI